MAHHSGGSHGAVHRKKMVATRDRYPNEDETIDILDLEKQLDVRLTTDERWAISVMFGPPTVHTDEDKKKARKIVKALTRELSQVLFGKRLVYAAMQDEVPLEKHAALLPYALPKAPTEIDVTMRREDMTDEQIQSRIDELLGNAKQVVDVTNS